MKITPAIKENITKILREQLLSLRKDKLVRISPERILAEELGISRLLLRMALKVLIEESLIIQKQGSGTYITPIAGINTVQLLIAPDIKTDDPFFTAFLAELSGWISHKSVKLSFIESKGIKESFENLPLIIVGLLSTGTIAKIKSVYKHIIAVQCCPDTEDIYQIYFDDYKIGYLAAKKFLEYNHKRILLLSGPAKYPSAFYRRKGFFDALSGTDVYITEIPGKMNWSCGYQAGYSVIKDFAVKENPTGIFAANDWMAIGLMQKLTEAGIRIPQDISIIGCDDIPIAKEVAPALTTFKIDFKCLISELISVLNEERINDQDMYKKVLLSAPFVKRESLRKI